MGGEFRLPHWITKRQMDVLMRIVPGPLGQGMTNQQAADDLGIGLRTVERVCTELRNKFPKAWAKVQVMRRAMQRDRKNLKCSRSTEGMIAHTGFEGLSDLAKETF
jgi:FixJ family two-component response regulator